MLKAKKQKEDECSDALWKQKYLLNVSAIIFPRAWKYILGSSLTRFSYLISYSVHLNNKKSLTTSKSKEAFIFKFSV